MPFRTKLTAVTGSVCALGAAFYLAWIATFPALPADETPALEVATVSTVDAFGIEADRYRVAAHVIQRGQTFSGLLTARGVGAAMARQLAEIARPVFNVRHLRAGKRLHHYLDSTGAARLLVYERDPIHYVVFDLREEPRVYAAERPVEVAQRAVSGVLEGSPYRTLERLGADPALALKLAEVFAWQIDFHHLRRGDRFHLVFEEKSIDGEPIGTGAILAARFVHADDDFYAFRFDADGQAGYYDERGRSLKKAFLKAPLRYSRISSRYSKRRFHPVQRRYKAHLGTDYAAPRGTPIHATSDGTVVAAAYTRGNGRYVKIRHNATYTTGYLHMSRIADGIRAGTRVRQGDVIGYVGSTGLATGPHLCYRFWKNGLQVDPLAVEMPRAEPLAEHLLPRFEARRAMFWAQLHHGATPPLLTDLPLDPGPRVGEDVAP